MHDVVWESEMWKEKNYAQIESFSFNIAGQCDISGVEVICHISKIGSDLAIRPVHIFYSIISSNESSRFIFRYNFAFIIKFT